MKTMRQKCSPKSYGLALRICLVLVMCAAFSRVADAGYPERPIRIVCGSGAGGIVDVTARILAERMSDILHASVVIENMPAAGSTVAIKTVSYSDPDGYTLLFTGAGISVVSALYPKSNIDVVKELKPISAVGDTPLVLFVHNSIPGKDYNSLIAYLKANPGRVNSGSNGRASGSYLAMALFKKLAGIEVVNVNYKSTPEVLTDLVAGRIGMAFSANGNGILKSPEIRPIGITALNRSKALPDVPTFSELGIEGLATGSPTMLLAPKGTPKDIIDTLATAVERSLADPTVVARLDKVGIIKPEAFGPDYAGKFLQREVTKWADVLRDAKD